MDVKNEMIEITESIGKGKGCFAKRDLKKSEVVEVSFYTRYSGEEAYMMFNAPIYPHVFVDPFQKEKVQPDLLVAWGTISMVNHDDSPNCEVEWGEDYVLLKTKRAITKGEELTLYYTNIHEYVEIPTKKLNGKPYYTDGQNYYGLYLGVDCDSCNNLIKDVEIVKDFLKSLTERLGMIAALPPMVDRIPGEKENQIGISGVQMLTTSSITIHTNDMFQDAYIDIFSCREYDVDVAIQFIKAWFDPKIVISHGNRRGVWR